MADPIKFSILKEGTVKLTTDEISADNHVKADALVKFLAEVLGGPVSAEAREKHHHHSHSHMHSADESQEQY